MDTVHESRLDFLSTMQGWISTLSSYYNADASTNNTSLSNAVDHHEGAMAKRALEPLVLDESTDRDTSSSISADCRRDSGPTNVADGGVCPVSHTQDTPRQQARDALRPPQGTPVCSARRVSDGSLTHSPRVARLQRRTMQTVDESKLEDCRDSNRLHPDGLQTPNRSPRLASPQPSGSAPAQHTRPRRIGDASDRRVWQLSWRAPWQIQTNRRIRGTVAMGTESGTQRVNREIRFGNVMTSMNSGGTVKEGTCATSGAHPPHLVTTETGTESNTQRANRKIRFRNVMTNWNYCGTLEEAVRATSGAHPPQLITTNDPL